MENALIAPAKYFFLVIPTVVFSILIPLVGIAVFAYIMAIRLAPLVKAAPDSRADRIPQRIYNVVKIWLGQYRQPRYLLAGVVHIVIFVGFLILSIRSCSLVVMGIFPSFVMPGFDGVVGHIYNFLKDYAATAVLVACAIAAFRRAVVKPERYAVPAKYGKDHTAEALFVLGLISTLMISESLFEASSVAANTQAGLHAEFLAPMSLAWLLKQALLSTSVETLQTLHIAAYYVHDLTFFFFLCFLPLGKHFHVITSLFNVFFMRIDRGNIKPVQHGVTDEQLDDLESFGVKKLEDFTWKHILDFYSCADCGRCSDNCPANAVGRPLSPRFISIKGRDLVFKNYPIHPYGSPFKKSEDLIGSIYEEDEIWSCTTCGACEQECPIGIEYIDKIVDLRRGMVDEGMVPQSLQKPLKALEKRGNPWGKMEKKRADWTKDLPEGVTVKDLAKDPAEALYFVDSITSYDDRMQEIGRATATILSRAGADVGILGKQEKDSGNEIRRFGEEMLFQTMKEMNTDAILDSGVKHIITADPHAYNALKNDYQGLPPVEHISQFITRNVKSGAIRLTGSNGDGKVYTYHDPCYLGRHNDVYEDPRAALDAIDGLKRVEMERCRDRSFCCGGGGLMLFYEPEEEQRMGVLRVEMAATAGANVIVTACPFCLVNMEDAIKVAGLEGKMEAIDLSELIVQHMA
ncbi:(Fe-S)-binding protein [Desulfosarcina sp.]|uniref:(Fe-S)-binding protein n=1 Tax=Desulfosarcina sp. TaxID=2027861 RepID=UPI0029A5DF20|nr:(Fe-S)-binding protein [Desulfosarcina sp.]MDX2453727.1 (Fe-S)-binding protein [Desulfosarcina sp.]MDX2491421.1 (Fe-S)-binding protein [Desulfosarcina sp.]